MVPNLCVQVTQLYPFLGYLCLLESVVALFGGLFLFPEDVVAGLYDQWVIIV
jgi:hypothetical protein